MPRIIPNLWFDAGALEDAQFYCGSGEEVQCGWLKDRYGLSWQIWPSELGELLGDPNPERAERAMRAMLGMVKLDIAAIRAAADG